MGKKYIYALTWINHGFEDNEASASAIAVSEDKEKLVSLMKEQIAKDCEVPKREDYEDEEDWDDARWSEDMNFKVTGDYGDVVYLQHQKIHSLYTEYRIDNVEYL